MSNSDTQYLIIKYRELMRDVQSINAHIDYLQKHRTELLSKTNTITETIMKLAYPENEK